MGDQYTHRQQTYEMALQSEDECITVAFEIDGVKILSKSTVLPGPTTASQTPVVRSLNHH